MTPTRKRKKHKTDAKASEQLRKWLTKEKPAKCVHPVSFQTFSKLVENLPDIAFEIQVTDVSRPHRTLDECAQWFYNAFYTDIAVRSNYEIKLRPCPLLIREKLLQFPSKEAAEPADGVEVSVAKCGRFRFPVTFATFEQYIDKRKLLPALARMLVGSKDKVKRKAFLKDKSKWRTALQKYYNSFYVFPNRRKYGFIDAPPALLEQLLKAGIPLDEQALKMLETEPIASTSEQSQAAKLQKSISSIVSFAVFEKYVRNIYDIAWRLKLNDDEYACKGFEDCALAYYLAFYLTPEIRDRYPFELLPCTTAMRDRILAFPNPKDVQMLQNLKSQSQQLIATQQSAISVAGTAVNASEVQLPLAEEQTNKETGMLQEKQPVTFAVFKSHIRNLERIVDEMLNSSDYQGKSREACALEYFKAFYRTPQIRERFAYELKPCPGRMRNKLLSIPEENSTAIPTPTDKPTVDHECAINLLNEQRLLKIHGITYVYLVSFETFMRFVNYEELREQIVTAHAKIRDELGDYPSETLLFKRFYHSFYIDKNLRKRFNVNFNAAPAELRPILMNMATTKQQPKDKVPKSVTETSAREAKEQPEEEEQVDVEKLSGKESQTECEKQPDPDVQMEAGEQLDAEVKMEPEDQLNYVEHTASEEQVDVEELTEHEKQLDFEEQQIEPEKQLDVEQQLNLQQQMETEEHLDVEEQLDDDLQMEPKEQLDVEEQLDCEQQMETEQQIYAEEPFDRQEQIEQLVYEERFHLQQQVETEEQLEIEEQIYAEEPTEQQYSEDPTEPDKQLYFEEQMDIEKQMEPEEQLVFEKQSELVEQLNVEEQLENKEQSKHEEQSEQGVQSELVEQLTSKQSEQTVTDQPTELMEQLHTEEQSGSEQQIEYEEQSANSNEKKKNQVVVLSERIMITLQGIKYEFPVSIQTFQRYINYDALKVELATSYAKTKYNIQKVLSHERSNFILLRRFYNSFYIDSRVRKMFNFNFDAAPLELQEKLLQYAVPLTYVAQRNKSKQSMERREGQQEDVAMETVEVAEVATVAVEATQSAVPEEDNLPRDEPGYPVSYRIFSKILRLDEVVKQMQLEPQYAQKSANDCKLIYFEAFYRNPKIRDKYICTMKPCPAVLKAKILELPTFKTVVNIENCNRSSASDSQRLAELYANRAAELASLKKKNVVEYIPHNLTSYIALRLPCPKKRLLLEKHFVGRKSARMETASGESVAVTKGNTEVTTANPEKPETAPLAAKSSTTKSSPIKNTAAKIVEKPNLTTEPTETAKTVETDVNTITKVASKTATNSMESPSKSIPTAASASVNQAEKAATVETTVKEAAKTATNSMESPTKSIATPVAKSQAEKAATVSEAKTTATNRLNSTHSKILTAFFTPIGKEHNMKYLVYTSHGLNKTIWYILSQLNQKEFKTYTAIYGAESLYKDEELLKQFYKHVIEQGNWPISLYVKLSRLSELLHLKGVYMDVLDLSQLPPKIFHWHELSSFTNFDDIVECEHIKRTNGNIKDLVQLFAEVEQFYTRCWKHNQWMREVPQITDRELIKNIVRNEKVETHTAGIPICLIEHNATAPDVADVMPLDESPVPSQTDIQEAEDCPATQLELSAGPPNFVDIESVCPASQAAETQNDPLMQSMLETVPVEAVQVETVPVEAVPVEAVPLGELQIKQEPVKFLNQLRFVINSEQSGEFRCETISTEEQIINLDNEDDERIAEELACFELSNAAATAVLPSSLDNQFQAILNEVNETESLKETQQLPIEVAAVAKKQNQPGTVNKALPALPTRAVKAQKQIRATTSTVPCKKPRLMADNVPQLRHDFRPLPLAAMVRIETNIAAPGAVVSTASSQGQQTSQSSTSSSSQGKQSGQLTVSQALATDNTLMESSQLQQLLDAPYVNIRQVNLIEKEANCNISDKNDKQDRETIPNPPVLYKHIVFSSLERYMYFHSLSTANISKYQINRLALGNSYQQALISANGQLCNVYGPLLENIFPHCTASLLRDLQYLLSDVGEFSYNCRFNLHCTSTEDLRSRVLYAFMRAAPPFAHMRLKFENESREWANCGTIAERDSDEIKRIPSCDVSSGIKCEILARMKELKSFSYL